MWNLDFSHERLNDKHEALLAEAAQERLAQQAKSECDEAHSVRLAMRWVVVKLASGRLTLRAIWEPMRDACRNKDVCTG